MVCGDEKGGAAVVSTLRLKICSNYSCQNNFQIGSRVLDKAEVTLAFESLNLKLSIESKL